MKRRTGSAKAARRSPRAPAGPQFEPLTHPSDPLNRSIINMLQEDGRLPYATIAQALGVSEGTVRNRVTRMIESKVLRIMAVADPLALGYTGYAMLGVKFTAGTDPDVIGGSFRRLPEVTYVLLVAGRHDLLVEVICETQAQLRDFIVKHCYRNPSVASVEAMMSLTTYKNLLKWGQP